MAGDAAPAYPRTARATADATAGNATTKAAAAAEYETRVAGSAVDTKLRSELTSGLAAEYAPLTAPSALLITLGLTPASFNASTALEATPEAALDDAFATPDARDEAIGLPTSTASLTIGPTALPVFSIAGDTFEYASLATLATLSTAASPCFTTTALDWAAFATPLATSSTTVSAVEARTATARCPATRALPFAQTRGGMRG
mmetsp:Transcript_13189/g.38226  ORF Transcript_13189/g.38226 Transcript_13189/m.38226 type:complete len:203 (-) Transcript_13189:94-702(-)